MTNQPNKATVKDGLPTAEQVLHRHFVPVDPFDNLQILQAIQEYSDQQNAELLAKIAKLEESYTKFAKERDEQYGEYIDLNVTLRNENAELRERVKELETQNKRLKIAHYAIVRAYEEYGPLAAVSTKQLSENVLKEIGFDPSKETL